MELLVSDQLTNCRKSQFERLEDRVAELEQKAREMDESIRYAGSIQQSMLPNELIFKNTFNEAFVMFQPKDIVSGDFYWIYLQGNDIYFAVGDCTGHGVPGAMVNIAGNTALRQIIRTEGVGDPARILEILDYEITGLFNENLTRGKRRDGMDLAFCKFNLASGIGQFCGAGRPLILVRDGKLVEFAKGPSIGYSEQKRKAFETIEFALEEGDTYYLFSDGYTDQFGGDNVKKFNRKRFRNMLLSINEYALDEQKKELDFAYNNWKGNQEQIDDVCVIGVRI